MKLVPEHLTELNKMHSNKKSLLTYLGQLLDMEIQAYVDEVIRPAYSLPKSVKNEPDCTIDLQTGEIKPFERQNSLNQE